MDSFETDFLDQDNFLDLEFLKFPSLSQTIIPLRETDKFFRVCIICENEKHNFKDGICPSCFFKDYKYSYIEYYLYDDEQNRLAKVVDRRKDIRKQRPVILKKESAKPCYTCCAEHTNSHDFCDVCTEHKIYEYEY